VTRDVDIGEEGYQQAVATNALLYHRGKNHHGDQRLGRRVEGSIPHPRLVRKDNRRGCRVGRSTASRSPSAQGMEDGPDKNKEDKQRDN
jgi:hypothetical protein